MTLNLTAMIDVTFLLLIYFLLATQFKLGEEVFNLDLPPQLQSDRERDPFELQDDPIRIEIASVGLARTEYRLNAIGLRRKPLTFDELYQALRDDQIAGGGSGGLYPADHPVVIIPSREARWEHAIAVFNAAHRARYSNINFAKPE